MLPSSTRSRTLPSVAAQFRIRDHSGRQATWSALAIGSYNVRCEKAGYLSITQRAVVRAGAVTAVQCRMSALGKPKAKPKLESEKNDRKGYAAETAATGSGRTRHLSMARRPSPMMVAPEVVHNTENYDHISENPYHAPTQTLSRPSLSTSTQLPTATSVAS